jgi:hypothetical protein
MNYRPSRIARGAIVLVVALAAVLIQLNTAAAADPVLAGKASQQVGTGEAVQVTADSVPVSTPSSVTSRPTGDPGVQATLGCPLPYLLTGYGPVGQCTLVSGSTGWAGFYSPITNQFNAATGPLAVHAVRWYSWNNGTIRGWTSLHTAYGPGVWATQYSGGSGRWGIVNLITSQFYPNSGWMPIV